MEYLQTQVILDGHNAGVGTSLFEGMHAAICRTKNWPVVAFEKAMLLASAEVDAKVAEQAMVNGFEERRDRRAEHLKPVDFRPHQPTGKKGYKRKKKSTDKRR